MSHIMLHCNPHWNKFRAFRFAGHGDSISGMSKVQTPLAKAMVAAGISANALANEIGTSRQNVGRWASGAVKLPVEQAQKIAPILKATVAELVLGNEPLPNEPVAVRQVHVRGNVQAGVWTEFEEFPDAPIEEVPIVPGKWAHLEQSAFKVVGPSMNRARLFDGDYVICVPYFLARAHPTNRDLAVIERRRGGTTERTVKRIEVSSSGVCLLRPESDDPRFQTPIPCNGPEPDGTEIEIVGLVIGSFTPR